MWSPTKTSDMNSRLGLSIYIIIAILVPVYYWKPPPAYPFLKYPAACSRFDVLVTK